MSETSARLGLPMLVPGQAQKEWFHNEALALLDLAVQPCVVATGINAPPAVPVPGQCWIVGDAPAAEWAGHAAELAGWTGGGWRFLALSEGAALWDAGAGCVVRRSGGSWVSGTIVGNRLVLAGEQVVGERQPAIPMPDGGATIDTQAREAVDAILSTLRAHGLIAA